MAKYEHLGLNKTDTLAADMASGATSGTLTTGSFGSPTGEQVLVIDYDVPAKIEEVICTISGTSLTSVTRTRAVDHAANAKVLFTTDTASHWSRLQKFAASELDKVRAVKITAGQTIPNATETAITLNSENFDTNSIHDNSTNSTRLTCKTAGKYIITGQINFTGNATGLREAQIRVNGTTSIASDNRVAGDTNDRAVSVSTIYELAVNDYIELYAYQSSGGDLIIKTDRTHLEMSLLP